MNIYEPFKHIPVTKKKGGGYDLPPLPRQKETSLDVDSLKLMI